jgi:hypothetical protein
MFEDFELDKYDSMRAKINVLANSYKIEELIGINKDFYKLYKGDDCDFYDILYKWLYESISLKQHIPKSIQLTCIKR